MRTQDILCPEESDVPTGMLTPHDTTIAHRSPLKRRQTISWASADGVSSLSPCRPVSEEYTTPESTSPRTTTDDEVSVHSDETRFIVNEAKWVACTRCSVVSLLKCISCLKLLSAHANPAVCDRRTTRGALRALMMMMTAVTKESTPG